MKRTVRDPQGRLLPPAVTASSVEYLQVRELSRRGRRMTADEQAQAAMVAARKYLELNPEEAIYGEGWPGCDEVERFAVACLAAARYWPKQLGEKEIWADIRARLFSAAPRKPGWVLRRIQEELRRRLSGIGATDRDDLQGYAALQLARARKRVGSYHFTRDGIEFAPSVIRGLVRHAASRFLRTKRRRSHLVGHPMVEEPPAPQQPAHGHALEMGVVDAVLRVEQARAVRHAIEAVATLRPRSRVWEFVTRHILEFEAGDLTNAEVARTLGVSEEAVRKVRHQVLAELERRLAA